MYSRVNNTRVCARARVYVRMQTLSTPRVAHKIEGYIFSSVFRSLERARTNKNLHVYCTYVGVYVHRNDGIHADCAYVYVVCITKCLSR